MFGYTIIKKSEKAYLEGRVEDLVTEIETGIKDQNKLLKKWDDLNTLKNKLVNAADQRIKSKENTIESKKTEINKLKVKIKLVDDNLKAVAKQSFQDICDRDDIIMEQTKEIIELRRQRKCLRENVRARNIRIDKLIHTPIFDLLNEKIRQLQNKVSQARSDNYNLQRKYDHLKKFVNSKVEKEVAKNKKK
jgi:hypothetical protein